MLNTFKFLFCVCFLIFSSCIDTINCNSLEYQNGLTYKNGKLYTGKCVTYYNDFKIKSKQQYSNGSEHGKWVFYYNNGNIQTSGEFNLGVRIGEWNYYFESNKVWKRNLYSNLGEKTGTWITYNEQGEVIDSTSIN